MLDFNGDFNYLEDLKYSSVFCGQNVMNFTAGNTFVQIVKILYMF